MHPITDVFFDYDYTLLDFDPGNAAAMAILATSYGAPFAQAFDGAFQTVLQNWPIYQYMHQIYLQ